MIRDATTDDLDKIFHLYDSHSLDTKKVPDPHYAAQVQKNGFLVALEGKTDLLQRIEEDYLYKVYVENDIIRGFININTEIYFPEDADNCIWFDETIKNSYFHSNTTLTLHEIIIDHENKRQGIGRKLLENSLTELKDNGYKDIFSIVTIGPVTNLPSILFHTKMGFKRACVTMPFDLFGMKDYMSLLFHKSIS